LYRIIGKNKNLTALKSNSNTVWFNFQTYIIFSINLVSLVTLRSSGTDTAIYKFDINVLCTILYQYKMWFQNQTPNWWISSTILIFSINLVSLVTLRSSGTDILYGCHLLLDVCIIYFISCDCIVNSSLSYTIY
jgi:hypothetical protein